MKKYSACRDDYKTAAYLTCKMGRETIMNRVGKGK